MPLLNGGSTTVWLPTVVNPVPAPKPATAYWIVTVFGVPVGFCILTQIWVGWPGISG